MNIKMHLFFAYCVVIGKVNFNYLQLLKLNTDCEAPKMTAAKINSSLVLMLDVTPAGQEALKKPRVEFIRDVFFPRGL